MAYQGAVHPDGTPIQGMPDGMQGRTMAWDTPADMMGPDGERHIRPHEALFWFAFGQASARTLPICLWPGIPLGPASMALACCVMLEACMPLGALALR